MASYVEHALRRLAAHAREWAGLPLTAVPSAAVSDDDNEYTSDMRYMRNLLYELEYACSTMHDATVPRLGEVQSGVLDMMLEDVRDDTQWQVTL